MEKNNYTYDLKVLSLDYFNAFSCKDLHAIEGMISSEVIIKDWEIYAEGKKEFLLVTKKIFDSINTIKVDIKKIYKDQNTIIAELEILIDNINIIEVIDVIHFDLNGKIINIRAFQG